MSTIIRQAPVVSSAEEFGRDLRRRFPWLKRNYVCIVWVQPIGKPAGIHNDVEWLPVIVDTGYNGTLSMRMEHFAEIGGNILTQNLEFVPESLRETPRGLCSTVELNARICANQPGQRRIDDQGRIVTLEFSTGIDVFLPADLDPDTKEIVWWDDAPTCEPPIRAAKCLSWACRRFWETG